MKKLLYIIPFIFLGVSLCKAQSNSQLLGKVLMLDTANGSILERWKDLAGAAGTSKFVLASQDTTTSSANVNANGFSFLIAANEIWEVEFGIVDSGIIQLGINAPSGAVIAGQSVGAQVAITAIDAQTAGLTNKPVFVTATIVNGSTAGIVQLRFATSTTAIIRPGSYMKATKMY